MHDLAQLIQRVGPNAAVCANVIDCVWRPVAFAVRCHCLGWRRVAITAGMGNVVDHGPGEAAAVHRDSVSTSFHASDSSVSTSESQLRSRSQAGDDEEARDALGAVLHPFMGNGSFLAGAYGVSTGARDPGFLPGESELRPGRARRSPSVTR